MFCTDKSTSSVCIKSLIHNYVYIMMKLAEVYQVSNRSKKYHFLHIAHLLLYMFLSSDQFGIVDN